MIRLKNVLLPFGAIVLAFLGASAFAFGQDDKWVSGWGQGTAEAIVTRGAGNEIYVTCGNDLGHTGINFMLVGRDPTGSSVQLTFDGDDPQVFSIWQDYPDIPTHCHACAVSYESAVEKMRSHQWVHVKFQNGDGARFTLTGASGAIAECVPDFAR